MAGERRERVLDVLRRSDGPVDAPTLAELLDLHVTTVRFHLHGLAEAGLVRSEVRPANGVGRPRTAYRAVRPPSYPQLVALLAARLGGSADDRERVAEQIGREWSATITPREHHDPTDLVIDVLDSLGFRTRSATTAFGTHTLILCACPLAATARRTPEVVRGIQRGLVQGVLDRAADLVGARFVADVVPDPAGGECTITLVLRQADARAR